MIYRIRISLDTEEKIYIDIKDNQTLWHLHEGIKSPFSLYSQEFEYFCYVDKDINLVKKITIEDYINNQLYISITYINIKEAFSGKEEVQLIYIYDFTNMRYFLLKLVEILNKPPVLNYPLTVKREGKIPLKNIKKIFTPSTKEKCIVEQQDFDNFFNCLQIKDSQEEYYEENL